MAKLLIRNLDDDVLKQLKAAAKAHGRSLQAEIHEVLRVRGAWRRRGGFRLAHEPDCVAIRRASDSDTLGA